MKVDTVTYLVNFLTPGFAEDLVSIAKKGNSSWKNLSLSILRSRNVFYTSLALSIIAAVGVALSSFGTLPMITFTAALITSLCVTLVALRFLFKKTLEFEKK